MSHESIIYGFIEGSPYKHPRYRLLQRRNKEILVRLPEHDQFPFLSRSMFSWPREHSDQGTFQAQVIHFGGSMNGLMSEEIPAWVEKFERLLRKLYWFEATAHIWTDFIDGCYQFWWHASESVIDTYWNENPQPSGQWDCQCLHFQRERHSPPINLWGEDRSG